MNQSSIQTFDTNRLVLKTTDPQLTQLNVCISSSLMTNYEPSRSVDSQHAIEVAEDTAGNPMVFSIGTANELYAILHTADPKAPWRQLDISSCLGAGWTVQTFRVLQVAGGSLYLALAAKDAAGASHFYLTAPLPNDPANAVWNPAFAANWVERSFANGFTSIDHILMSAGASPTDAPVVLATATGGTGEAQRFYVNADLTTQLNLWQPWPVPQNASRILDVAVGTLPVLGAGSFALYLVGSTLQLDFTMATQMSGQYISRSFTPPAGAAALGTLQHPDGTTDLYMAGNGVYVYTSDNMQAYATPVQIGTTLNAGIGTELAVRQDSGSIALWVLDQGVLSYMHGTKGAGAPTWTTPLPVQSNVGQIAALRNTTRDTNELFLVTADEQLSYLYQDPGSTIWQRVVLPLADVGAVLPFQCYTTHITLRDQANAAVVRPFGLSSSQWSYLTVNGAACICDADTTAVVTSDATGGITVISKVSSLSTPTITLHAGFLEEVIDINPQALINNNLKNFTTPDALTGATTQTGQPVVPGTTTLPVDSVAQALSQLTLVHDSNGNPTGVSVRHPAAVRSNVLVAGGLPSSASFAMTGVGTGQARYHDAAAAPAVLPDLHAHALRTVQLGVSQQALFTSNAGDEVKAFFGDVLQALLHGLEKIGDFFVNVANEVATFTIKLAEGLYTVILDTVEKVMQVMSWLLQQLEIGLEKLIDWLGFIFGWDDILQAHRIIVNATTKSLEYAEAQVSNAQTVVAGFFTQLRSSFDALQPPTGANATASVLSQTNNPTPSFPASESSQADYLSSPGGSFASYHVQHSGVLNATARPTAAPPTGNALVDAFTQVLEPVVKDVGQTFENMFIDLRNGFVAGTLTPTTALAMVKTDAVSGLLNTAEDAAEGLLTVANDIVTSLESALTTAWDIPFLSPLYKLITKGSDLNLLDAMALLLAIPAVPMYKLVAGKSPFANGTLGLDDTSVDASTYFANLKGTSTAQLNLRMQVAPAAAAKEAEAGDNSLSSDLLYSQIGGCIYCIAEILSLVMDAAANETEGEEPPALKYIHLVCETVMLATSFPVGDGSAVTLLRFLWGFYVVFLVRFALLIFGSAAMMPVVGIIELFGALIKIVFFFSAIIIQTASDSGAELALEWETFVGNLLDGIARGLSGCAKLDPDKEVTGLALDAIATGVGFFAVVLDAVRLAIVLVDDELQEYHAF
jgi:hypothetical protein